MSRRVTGCHACRLRSFTCSSWVDTRWTGRSRHNPHHRRVRGVGWLPLRAEWISCLLLLLLLLLLQGWEGDSPLWACCSCLPVVEAC